MGARVSQERRRLVVGHGTALTRKGVDASLREHFAVSTFDRHEIALCWNVQLDELSDSWPEQWPDNASALPTVSEFVIAQSFPKPGQRYVMADVVKQTCNLQLDVIGELGCKEVGTLQGMTQQVHVLTIASNVGMANCEELHQVIDTVENSAKSGGESTCVHVHEPHPRT